MKFTIDTETKLVQVITDNEISFDELSKISSELPYPYNTYTIQNGRTVITMDIGGGGGSGRDSRVVLSTDQTNENAGVITHGFVIGNSITIKTDKL
jgi:hypothetical protein